MSIEEVALEAIATHAPDALLDALGIIWEETPTLMPGVDFHDGTLYMTLPATRPVKESIGRGNARKEVEKLRQMTFTVTSDRRIFLYDEETVTRNGFLFPKTFTQQHEARWPLPLVEDFLRGRSAHVDPASLFGELRQVYTTHVEYREDIYYDVMPLYLLGTYVFPLFASFPYIHFNGTRATGKSQNLRLITAFGLNPLMASNISTASLFRSTAGLRSVICLDEAESWDTERGAELKLILNSGYNNATGYASRTVPTDVPGQFVNALFPTYGPKVIASIAPLDAVLGSRCIVVHMEPALRVIPEFRADDPRWGQLRNQIYLWAMQHAADIAELNQVWMEKRHTAAPNLKSRHWELANPILVLADHLGGDQLVAKMVGFFEEYFTKQLKAEDETDRLRVFLKTLPAVLRTKQPWEREWYALKDVLEVFKSELDEDAAEKTTTNTISRYFTSLGIDPTDRRSKHGGRQVRLTPEWLRGQFDRRRIVPDNPEDVAWLAGDADITIPGSGTLELPEEENEDLSTSDHDYLNTFNWNDD